jgi:hypothetical protein
MTENNDELMLIREALHQLEEAHIVGEADRSLGVIEYPEDY